MTLNHHDHINPIFSWVVVNNTNESISAKSRGGFEYIIPSTNKERTVTGGEVKLIVEFKNVYIDRIAFNVSQACTKLDKSLMEMLEARRQEMLNDGYLARSSTQTISVGIVIKNIHVESDDGVHSDMLGVSFFMDNDLSRQGSIGIPKGTPTSINNKLMWEDNYDEILGDASEATRDRCVAAESRLTVLYNDPTNIFSGLWMNVLGQAKRINHSRLADILPGLYITYRSGVSNNELIERYYSFDQLNEKALEEMGIFLSKEAAQKGGNTERYLQAEATIKSLNQSIVGYRKEITQLIDKNSNLTKDLNKEETTNLRLTNEIAFLKQDSRLKDREQKIAIETIKGANKPNNTASFVDICKGVGLLTTAGVTVYKVFAT
ncbi:hypothetical protein NFI00_000063 [Salmonella enterica]|nr:hypothetical protein [Salmonella enterica]